MLGIFHMTCHSTRTPLRKITTVLSDGGAWLRLGLECGHEVKVKSCMRRGKDGVMRRKRPTSARCDWCVS